MKKYLHYLILVAILGISKIAFADSLPDINKQYSYWSNGLQKPIIDQVISNEEGVFLHVDNFWLCTEGFQTTGIDSFVMMRGEWVSLSEGIECGARLTSWKCTRCQRFNLEGINACAYCGKPRYE